MEQKIQVLRGIAMPFFPMRPVAGRRIANRRMVNFILEKTADGLWLMTPKLNGDRAVLAVHQDKIYIQNRHGGWYKHEVKNRLDFLALGNGTVLDGEVYKGEFYPFEALAYKGKSLLMAPASLREIEAFGISKLLGHRWMFDAPKEKWLEEGRRNGPAWEGVVLKNAFAPYRIGGSATASTHDWMKHKFS